MSKAQAATLESQPEECLGFRLYPSLDDTGEYMVWRAYATFTPDILKAGTRPALRKKIAAWWYMPHKA